MFICIQDYQLHTFQVKFYASFKQQREPQHNWDLNIGILYPKASPFIFIDNLFFFLFNLDDYSVVYLIVFIGFSSTMSAMPRVQRLKILKYMLHVQLL